jgi:dTDP-4-dehydrorhamnose reductase
LPVELWAGHECTVHRIGDRFHDQTALTGHQERLSDLELFANLGIRALRYPVLWERVAPNDPNSFDWRWTDERLARIRDLGIKPIVGLVHHGSGPRYTRLDDPSFVVGLETFARAAAERYPWVHDWTPINEPLTTARFSGLYGHWFPHERSGICFAKCLITQVDAIGRAMRAIRSINPAARLIQTEDLGKTHSTPPLAYQAAFENERRWLTFDLLMGRVGPSHSMWRYLRALGPEIEDGLSHLKENVCPPDVLGMNHYLSSERFLDDRLHLYDQSQRGGNGRDRYVDVLAARVLKDGPSGPKSLMQEAWNRYGMPMAVTEVHNGCTREEQLRWFSEVWHAACELRSEGAKIEAVTAWALLGAFDWDHLLTTMRGHYEPGVFDIRCKPLRQTAVARYLSALAQNCCADHPVLDTPGWWRRPERLNKPLVSSEAAHNMPSAATGDARRILIIGASGTLGRAFTKVCARRGLANAAVLRSQCEITSAYSIAGALDEIAPWAVINCAGYVRVADAETDAERCMEANCKGPELLALACARRSTRLITFSSDLVFGGSKDLPYLESDTPQPLNVYGKSKAEAEQKVLAAWPDALVIRTSAFFGPWDRYNFVLQALASLGESKDFLAAEDVVVSPTYVPDLANACLDLLIDGESGIWHLANKGQTAWSDFARAATARFGFSPHRIVPRPWRSLEPHLMVPRFSALASARGGIMPSLESALERFVDEVELDMLNPELANQVLLQHRRVRGPALEDFARLGM